MPSQNSFFVSSKCYRFIGIAIKQLDAPFSQARSSEQTWFLFGSLLICVFFDLIASSFSFFIFCMIGCRFSSASCKDKDKGLDSLTDLSYYLKQSSS